MSTVVPFLKAGLFLTVFILSCFTAGAGIVVIMYAVVTLKILAGIGGIVLSILGGALAAWSLEEFFKSAEET